MSGFTEFNPETGTAANTTFDKLTERLVDCQSDPMDALLRHYIESARQRILYLERKLSENE